MSRRYLFYTEEELAHRIVYVPEWASIADDDELVAMLRTLLSEGRIVHGTVEGDGQRTARRIEKEGPTGLLMTTTAAQVDAEMETRCLSVLTDDTVEQTRRVFETLADLEDEVESPVDFEAWHELQEWIAAHGETRVVVPFVRALAEKMPAGATRLRRDFVTLICLIRAHAILYRAQREQDEHGRIVATIKDDYAPVRDLVAEVIAEGVDAGVSEAMRETVEAVRVLLDEGADHVSPSELVPRLGVGQSATYDRVRRALQRGYLVNDAGRNDRRIKLAIGALLPGDREFLPSPEALFRVVSGSAPGEESRSTIRVSEVDSGIPALPADPPEKTDDLPCGHAAFWTARDGTRHCRECDPPSFPERSPRDRLSERSTDRRSCRSPAPARRRSSRRDACRARRAARVVDARSGRRTATRRPPGRFAGGRNKADCQARSRTAGGGCSTRASSTRH